MQQFKNPIMKNVIRSILPQVDEDADSNFHLFIVRVNDRAKFQEYLALKGIQTLIHYPIPVHKQKFLKNKYSHISLRVTEKISDEIVSIPLFPEFTDEEVEYIIECVNEFTIKSEVRVYLFW